MDAEAAPTREHYGLQSVVSPWSSALPMRVYRGSIPTGDGICELNLVHNGQCTTHGVDNIGTQPATLATYIAIEHLRPDLLINAGTCGGFQSRGAQIGDVYVADPEIQYHDRRIAIPGFESYGRGHYPSLRLGALAETLGLKRGVVSTGNALDMPAQDRDHMNRYGVHAKDMEAAAIAWVAHLLHAPLIALKSVTDIVDGAHPTEEEFLRNLARASERLQDRLSALISAIAGRSLQSILA